MHRFSNRKTNDCSIQEEKYLLVECSAQNIPHRFLPLSSFVLLFLCLSCCLQYPRLTRRTLFLCLGAAITLSGKSILPCCGQTGQYSKCQFAGNHTLPCKKTQHSLRLPR